MKAAVLNDYAKPLDLEEVEIEPPRAGEVQELISRRYTLDEINEGFERLGEGKLHHHAPSTDDD